MLSDFEKVYPMFDVDERVKVCCFDVSRPVAGILVTESAVLGVYVNV